MDDNPRINEINEMLDHMEDVLEDSKQALLSTKVVVNKEEFFDIIRDIRLRLPNEIQQSRWVVADRTKILTQAQIEADTIIDEAQETVNKLIEEHEITQYAHKQAEKIISAASNDARELHLGAVEYADNVLKDVELHLKDTLDVVHNEVSGFQAYMGEVINTLYANRKELKGVVPLNTNEEDREGEAR